MFIFGVTIVLYFISSTILISHEIYEIPGLQFENFAIIDLPGVSHILKPILDC
jgi:hypothetical protein